MGLPIGIAVTKFGLRNSCLTRKAYVSSNLVIIVSVVVVCVTWCSAIFHKTFGTHVSLLLRRPFAKLEISFESQLIY
jgi:hypothetical protein